MKTLRFFLIALLSVFVLASCSKKSDELNPDSGIEVAGTYSVNQFRTPAGQVGTITGAAFTIIVTRVNESQVTIALRSVPTGQSPRVINVPGTVDLEQSGNTINFFVSDGSQVATYTGGTLELDFEDPTMTGTFIAKKQ